MGINVDILYYDCFKLRKVDKKKKIRQVNMPLHMFSGESILLIGSISLPLTIEILSM